jgi:peptide deformylase
MAVREILLLGNEQLWQPSAAVERAGAPEVRETVTDLGETLADFRLRHGFGRAIAAPQIGRPLRIIFLNMQTSTVGLNGLSSLKDAGAFGPAPLINPRIVRASPEMIELWDDCFSFPDLMVRVRRHLEIEVEYEDLAGGSRSLVAREDLSELLQHEIDHLDGVLATDRAIDRRSFALSRQLRSETTPNTYSA